MVERFNALADRNVLEFEAWFNDREDPERSWDIDEKNWRFKYRYLPRSRILGSILHWPLPVLGRRPDMLVSLYSEPVFLVGWIIAKLRGSKTGFWLEVTFDSWVARNSFKETLKRRVLPAADVIITVGKDGQNYATKYGAQKNRIRFAPHVIDGRHFASLSKLTSQRRATLRQANNLHGTTYLYVGRLWRGKGLDTLLRAFRIVQTTHDKPVSLLLVGDGPDEQEIRQYSNALGLHNVVFTGFIQKADLPPYYGIADVFVFPSLGDPYGLVVDEAMACSLPVICTACTGEIHDRVQEDVNGHIVPPENVAIFARRMLGLARDDDKRQTMGRHGAAKMQLRTPQQWASAFEDIVLTILNESA